MKLNITETTFYSQQHTSELARLSRHALGALLFCAAITAQGQEPEETAPANLPTPYTQLLFVETPVRFEPELDPVLPDLALIPNPEDDPEFSQRLEAITNYESVVADLELNGGAWEPGLVEELTALAVIQQQQGNHLEAVEIFDRAIHVNRIHSGLNTLEQIPAVEKMIESYLALGDWEQADLYNDYLFYIQQRAYGPHDPRMIPVLDRLASWNIQAFNIGYGDSLGFRLNTAQILLQAAVNMVTVHFGENDGRYVRYRRNIANSAYLASRNPQLMAEIQQPDFRNMQDVLLNKLDARESIRPIGYQAGEVALREIVRHYAAQDDKQVELASALADLGDWYLLFERRRTAQDLYKEAWDILATTENGEQHIQRLFGQVTPIPTFTDSIDNLLTTPITKTDGTTLSYDYADVVFDVTDSGKARNIEILSEETEYNSGLFSRLQREIRGSYFRPIIVDGEVVRSDRNYFRYRYWY